MKPIAIIVAALITIPAALAQQPVEVPKPNCEPKPDYPGRLALQSEYRRKQFDREVKNYKDCTMAYLDARKATIEANTTAGNAAVAEYNAVMKKITEGQAADAK